MEKKIDQNMVDVQIVTVPTVFGIRMTIAVRQILFVCAVFFIPLFISGPQLLTGSIVNLLLIAAVRKLPRSRARPLAFVPSIAAVLHGVIFGPFTIFLVYMMPAIWIGNLIFMSLARKISSKRIAIAIGSVSKAAFLFLIAFVLFNLHFLPAIFLKAMGIFQLITALIGGYVAFGFSKLSK